MNLRQALYMKTIAEKGGITAAAKQLYISQPSLSQMLRQIEEEAGVPLFDRSSLSFRPTYAGERYLHAASVLLNTNEILENELREIRGEERGRLRLGISMLRSAQLLPCVLPECSCFKRGAWIWRWLPPNRTIPCWNTVCFKRSGSVFWLDLPAPWPSGFPLGRPSP